MSKALNTVNPATLQLIKKLVAAACDETRAQLGEGTGEFVVDETIVIHAEGRVGVAKSTPDAIKAQAARPWDLVAVLFAEINKDRAAAGKAGIDMAKVVEMAEALDPTLAKKAKKAADAEMAAIKEPTRSFKWGGVSPKGSVEVLATGDNLKPDTEGAEEAAE